MAQLDKLDDTLFMVSYRDPNLVNTLEIYDGVANFLTEELEEKVIMQKEITRVIIGCIGALDGSALPPRNAGWISFNKYLSNSSATCCQIWHAGILNTKEEIEAMENASVAVVGSEHDKRICFL
jgi:Zn-dependent M16 (insulinase) family peptidase